MAKPYYEYTKDQNLDNIDLEIKCTTYINIRSVVGLPLLNLSKFQIDDLND